MKKFILYAPNVNNGGGLILLNNLISSLQKSENTLFVLDVRIKKLVDSKLKIKFVKARLFNRIAMELWLFNNTCKDDTVLFFGNLPPLFPLHCKKILFLQNRLLVDYVSLKSFNFKSMFRIKYERFWLRNRISNLDKIIVQTFTMSNFVKKLIFC